MKNLLYRNNIDLVHLDVGDDTEIFPVFSFTFIINQNTLVKIVVVDRPDKRIICIPTSDGCTRKCIFCASAYNKFNRMLSFSELDNILQYVLVHPILPESNSSILLSLMGVGEPLDNINEVYKFLSIYSNDFKTALATTVPSMNKLLDLQNKFNKTKILISLHSGLHSTRKKILNSNCYSPEKLFSIFTDTVEYNYVVVKKINDSNKEIFALNDVVKDKTMKIKINTLNSWPGINYTQGKLNVEYFKSNVIIEFYSTDATSIFGACGQCGYLKNNKKWDNYV